MLKKIHVEREREREITAGVKSRRGDVEGGKGANIFIGRMGERQRYDTGNMCESFSPSAGYKNMRLGNVSLMI